MNNFQVKSLRTFLILGLPAIAAGNIAFTSCHLMAASPAHVSDRGIFIIKLAGKQIGTERFEIRARKNQIEAEAKVELQVVEGGKTLDFRTSPRLILTPDLLPQTYEWDQKGAQSSKIEMDLRKTPATVRYRTVSGGNDARDFVLPRDVVIVDNNVIHHYQLVLSRLRLAGGGKQAFPAFIPQEALPGTLNVEETEQESVDLGGTEKKLRHLIVTTENARIDLWADSQDHLQKLVIPSAQLEVRRAK